MPALRLRLLLITSLVLPLSLQAAEAPDAPLHHTPEVQGLWELYREARETDQRVLAAEARQRSSAWTEREAFGQLLPQINASASGNRTAYDNNTLSARYSGERYSASISQVIYAPEVWHRYQRFQSQARQQEASSRDTRERAALDLVDRYFKALAARDQLDLVEAELKATERNHEQLQAMLARQMATITDTLEIGARVDTLKARRIDATSQLTIALEALGELLGRPVSEPLQRIDERALFVMPPRDREEWVQMALERNPALLARQAARDAAGSAVREAYAGHLPRLELNLTGQQSNIGYENSLNPRTETYVATLGLSLPLYSGGSTSAGVASAEEEFSATSYDLEALRRQVMRETRAAFHGSESSQQRIQASRQALLSASKSREASEQAFRHGVMNAVNVLDSIRDEFRARRDLLQAQYDFIFNLLSLQRWSGSQLEVDIRRTAAWLSADTH